ncbi:MAG: hypothetical protein WB785_00130 [Mycobacterium sp.]|uniref:hypothetical protein n=1 Tax=Mycobacterium sp. TaxID=1785 RepID=UPI003C6903B5
MTLLAAIAALAAATCLGYYCGRRVGSTRSTWKKRTSRLALGRLMISLLVVLSARQIRRRFRAERVFTDALQRSGLRVIAPVELLRGSVARTRT